MIQKKTPQYKLQNCCPLKHFKGKTANLKAFPTKKRKILKKARSKNCRTEKHITVFKGSLLNGRKYEQRPVLTVKLKSSKTFNRRAVKTAISFTAFKYLLPYCKKGKSKNVKKGKLQAIFKFKLPSCKYANSF